MPIQFTFRKPTASDLPMLAEWRSSPHVLEWWGAASSEDDRVEDPRVARWIVEAAGVPFAYMQDYSVHGWDGHHFSYLPKGARGIDQYIGRPDMLGRGYGSAFIAQRMRALFAAGVPVIATDPHPENERAIAVYKKVGFRVVGAPQMTEWGLILPMEARR